MWLRKAKIGGSLHASGIEVHLAGGLDADGKRLIRVVVSCGRTCGVEIFI